MGWRNRSRPCEDVPISIVVEHDAMSATGSVRWANILAEHWAASGLSVSIFALRDARGVPLAPPAGVTLAHGGSHGARLRQALPRALPRFFRTVSQTDVVLVPSEIAFLLPLSYVACRTIRRPLVVIVQSVPDHSIPTWVPRWRRRLWRYCLRHADAIVCVSQGSADSLLRLGVPADRVAVVHAGVDVQEVVRAAHDRPPSLVTDDNRPVLIAVGELSPAKGYDLLLQAIANVRAQGHLAQLVILGEGAERARLERLAADLGITDSVQLPGFVPNPYPEMLAADLYCLSSRWEGFPLCVLEAMALGIPTVATDTDSGGPRTLLDGGRLGALIPPGSVEALTKTIVRHLEQPEVLRSRALAGPAHVRQFNPAAAAAACRDIFVRVAGRSVADEDVVGQAQNVRR
jgi:glycosyltransferase involved in cell wall biosynthesis